MIQPDEIIRSRRRTLSITIDPFGRLIVRAPYSFDEERIFAFLQQKEHWITQKKSQMAGAGMRLPSENLDGYEFMLLGKSYTIHLTDEKRIVFDEAGGIVYLPKENARKKLVAWLKTNAKRIMTTVTQRVAQEMGVEYQSITITSAKRRWGSCSFDNKLRYTFRLIYAPKEVIEYVAVHELCHVKHKNHSPLFWAEVARFVPDWKQKRSWLKNHSILMEIF